MRTILNAFIGAATFTFLFMFIPGVAIIVALIVGFTYWGKRR